MLFCLNEVRLIVSEIEGASMTPGWLAARWLKAGHQAERRRAAWRLGLV